MKKKILSLVLACCLFLLSGCGSVGSVMKNIKAGNVDEANQLYLEKIAGNSEKEFDLEDALQTYIEGLYDDLNSGKVSSAEAQAFASTVYSMDMDSSSYTRKILSKLNDLILSKQAYEDAMDAVAGEDYLTAYMLLQNVIEEDSNYETASSKMNEIVNDGMRSLNQEIDDAVAAKEFQKAIDLVNEAISLWGNNEFLASMQDSIPTWWQESNIEEAEQLRQAGQYSEAKDKAIEYCLAFGLDEYPDAVSTELQLINAEWLNSVAQEAAAAFGANKDYQAAIRVLQASGLQGDDVDALIEQYQGYHFEKPYKMDDGDYRLEKVDDNTYTVIVLADKYVEKYNAVYPGHTLFDNNTKTIKLVYRYGAWTVVGSNGVTFNVSCEQKYTVTYTDGVDGEVIFADQVSYKKPGEKTPKFRGTPTRTGYKFIGWEPAVVGTVTANATYTAQWVSISDLDPAPELVSSLYMNFQCTNENASHDHRSEMIAIGYGIGAGGVIVTDAAGNPVYNKDGNITAVITFYQDSGFLNEYNKRTGVAHRYADYEPKTKSVDGVLIGEVFHMYKKDYPVVFDVVCGSLYTVTYKDGTNGTVFADDVHSNLNANAATPAFVGGTPTRPGYVFTGWNPAVAATVTGNATYTAVWEKDANGNGKPDKDEEKYTVTYTDGVENEEIFADETYSDLLSGTATPAFNGTPTRKGYVFTGWNPAVAATVTGNATYAAVWEEAAPPKPDKPTPPTDEIGGATVAVKCITGHGDLSWKIGSSTFTVGEVTGDDTTGYTCTVTVQAEVYVNAFNSNKKANGVKHTLADDAEKTFTMTYVNGAWTGPTNPAVTFEVKCEEELVPVHLVIYRNGDTSKAYKDVALESQPKGHVIDLSTIDIADYYTGNYEFYGWYDDGLFNIYKSDPANPPAGLKEKTVNGWTNLKCMVYDKYQVVYFQSEEALRDFQNDHSKTEGRLYSTTAPFGSTLPTADAPTPTRTGYTFKFWSREGQNGDVTGQTVNGWTNLYAVWEKNTYTVTYTDGVNGEAFPNKTYPAKYEDATPAFEGTPARKGFVFDGWNPEVAETVTDNATYTAQWKPVQPDKKAIEGAIGRGVAVVCDNQNVNHGEKKYKPTLGEYTVSNVMGTAADGYTCTVTVRAAKFIEKYSSDMSDAVHTLIAGEPAEKTIELKWNGEKWVAETELPVTFHTLCPPEQPSKKDIEGAIGRGVKIVCDNQNVNHWGKDYKPTQGEYTVSDVTGTASEGYTCTITVKAAKIIEKYSSDMGKTHALIVGEQPEKTVELKWNGEKWVAKTELPITFHVECPPEKPTYDELKGLGINAKVDCTTTTAHNGKSYTLIEDTYNVSDPERKGTVYTCILTVNAKDYVAKYNAEENVGPHTLDDRDSKTIELTWNGEKWTAAETSVTFNVKCELLTVTYTDGVKGEEVFADVVYKDIPYGTGTPAFGTKDPTRKGYKFVGWEPEVAETVTKDVTYTAKWEKLYTVTYTDGVKGKAFKDQVYSDLEAGTDTPKFDGKPTRKGYTFTGWSPKVTDTVTKDVTYVAQWKSVKNGKDNIPKTGDSEIVMVLGSVLLFSFCGAAAVSVYDRKRKHF